MQSPKFEFKNIRVGNAGSKGLGVFATKNIKKGQVIEKAPVILLNDFDTEIICFSELGSYAFSVTTNDDQTIIGLGYASLYNHSFKPNAEYLPTAKVIVFRATKNIKAGEEISINYGWGVAFYKECGIPVPDDIRLELEKEESL